jgi:hypothetical protein
MPTKIITKFNPQVKKNLCFSDGFSLFSGIFPVSYSRIRRSPDSFFSQALRIMVFDHAAAAFSPAEVQAPEADLRPSLRVSRDLRPGHVCRRARRVRYGPLHSAGLQETQC